MKPKPLQTNNTHKNTKTHMHICTLLPCPQTISLALVWKTVTYRLSVCQLKWPLNCFVLWFETQWPFWNSLHHNKWGEKAAEGIVVTAPWSMSNCIILSLSTDPPPPFSVCGSLPGTFGGRVSHHHTFSDFPEFTKIISKAVCEEETETRRFQLSSSHQWIQNQEKMWCQCHCVA